MDTVKKKPFPIIVDFQTMITCKSSVLDPDADYFQIQMGQPIRIRIEITDPDPGGPKSSPTYKRKK
jgi:hypothetical protein